MAKQTKAEKLERARISRIYASVAHGVQIPLLEVPKVYKVGAAAIAAGDSDEQIAAKILDMVQKIRTN